MPIVKICQDILFIKDHRDEFRRKAFFYAHPLIKAIMERYTLTYDEVWYILPSDVARFEKERNEVLSDIAKRKDGYWCESNGKETIFLQGEEAKRLFIKEAPTFDVKEIKGIVGCPGNTTGFVQVTRNAEDLKHFKQGNILVATTTNPDYITAMQKAVAFVTDEGGITCHAAIVAREMRKPCIVGTKIATRVLKDGDFVEVDAQNGIVRVLQS
jgi:pyruvate,water dikinase